MYRHLTIVSHCLLDWTRNCISTLYFRTMVDICASDRPVESQPCQNMYQSWSLLIVVLQKFVSSLLWPAITCPHRHVKLLQIIEEGFSSLCQHSTLLQVTMYTPILLHLAMHLPLYYTLWQALNWAQTLPCDIGLVHPGHCYFSSLFSWAPQ